MAKILIKRPDNDALEEATIRDIGGWNNISEIVGEGRRVTLDRVHLSNNPYELTLYVDDDGLPKDLAPNFLIHTNNYIYPVQMIVGVAVFARGKIIDDDVVYEDLTPKDRAYINWLITEGKIR